MKIINLEQIYSVLPAIDLIPTIEAGFVAYSDEKAVVPPVGELLLDKGEVHIKYGFLQGDEFYVIKVASGFYDNPKIGLPSSNGLMLLFSQLTGELAGILLDEGYLTNVRTAVAGAIAAKYLTPKSVERIGIVGTGIQGQLQLEYLRSVTSCRNVLAWDLDKQLLTGYQNEMMKHNFQVETTLNAADILRSCNLIVTATPSTEPLLHVDDLQPGTHITAVGSDTPHKQELDSEILARADIVVADSISQCLARGEIHQAIKRGKLMREKVVELGNVISGKTTGRVGEDQISVADLTGVAVQDIQIASAVYRALL
ncbi:MAG: ornithine cyclodeaminase family protein [Chloroflexi bacterium]|nr:ornithine cyclodeaminase family protein [Chloroflexota bacterium]